MVGRIVAVKVGNGVFVASGVPVEGVVEGSEVLITNKFGVFVASSENGVAVGFCVLITAGVGVCKNGMEIGSPLQPARRETNKEKNKNLFITPLQCL
jgi:hypothetical protein